MTVLLRELIEIPTAVRRGDFVISLATGVTDPDATLGSYVVTEQLADAFDNALGFIASAVRENRSKAAYLDGSFGAGKSHFMAVLHLLLERNARARAIPELADAIAAYDPVLGERSFDLVPVHMIGAETIEERIFATYVRHCATVDPQVPPPALFLDGPIFQQADQIRAQQGDERFFAILGGATQGGEGWGDLATWNAATYAAARGAPAGDARRAGLVGDLIATHMPMFLEAFRGMTGGWVDFDVGLAEMTRHARARGKNVLVLFLDELILWLGSRMADQAFVAREGPKLVKLVEYTHERELPIVAFVARQRDLREFIGDEVPGAERLSFMDALRYWNDRFHRIELADRNLPKIAQRRLLEPVSDAARAQLDGAFAELERSRSEVLRALMTDDSDREAFRLSYPFSPAFMKTLVAASSALQRERTALLVMLQLLVDNRDELALGDLVGVGELFDVLSGRDEPFAEDLRRQFNTAKQLYAEQLRPLLLAEHGLSEGQADGLPRQSAFRADDRLIKTLLIAALVSGAEPLRNLDIAKLTALNHGSIASPIPGGERTIVLAKLRRIAAAGAPLRIGEDPHNPSVALRLTGVDIDSVIVKAASVDNPGLRRQLVKRLLYRDLGIADDERLLPDEHRVLWRGTWRTVDIVFGNVRDESVLPADALRAAGERWKVVIDYPFDDPLHSPAEDLERLDRWRSENSSTRTVCWIPAFFSPSLQSQLGRLVVIDYVLSGENFERHADHLSRQDQAVARGLLDDQASVLRERIRSAIRQAYGVERAASDTIDDTHELESRLQSLAEGFTPELPIGAQLRDAFEGLVRKMLDVQYPEHPLFAEEIRVRDLKVVWDEVQRAFDAGGRIDQVPSDRRRILRRIANPLELGTQHEAPFVLETRWKDRLDQEIARARADGLAQLTVGELRAMIDRPRPRGLTREVSALVILTYAQQTGRSFRLIGGPAGEVGVDRLADELELVTARLPSAQAWAELNARASGLFGFVGVNPARNPASVEALAAQISRRISELRRGAAELVPALERRLRELAADVESADRARSAHAALAIVDAAGSGDDVDLIERVAAVQLPTSAQAVGTSLVSAAPVARALDDERWQVLERVVAARAGNERADAIIARLSEAVKRDEFAEPLEPAIARAYSEGVALLAPPPRPAPPPLPPPPPPPPPDGVRYGEAAGLTLPDARTKLDELAREDGHVTIDLTWTITPRS
jgi:hypothetical protein